MSRSTFIPSRLVMNIEPNVARILAKSRINNRRNGLVGVLYFGDGCFFQCLEGEETAIDTLYAKLMDDTRHKEIKLFSRKPVTALTFPDWAMKYVPLEKPMSRLLATRGFKTFDPYKFDAEMIQSVMSLLHSSADPTAVGKAENPIRQATESPVNSKENGRLAIFAIILSLIIIGAVVFALNK